MSRLPVRDDVKTVEYHRNPTSAESYRGYGVIHYRTFTVEECCKRDSRILKRWFVADDGLRYYR